MSWSAQTKKKQAPLPVSYHRVQLGGRSVVLKVGMINGRQRVLEVFAVGERLSPMQKSRPR